METLAGQQTGSSTHHINFENLSSNYKKQETEISNKLVTATEKHSDIISCVTKFLEDVPNEKLMLCKVRLFQFIEDEKNRLRKEI